MKTLNFLRYENRFSYQNMLYNCWGMTIKKDIFIIGIYLNTDKLFVRFFYVFLIIIHAI